MRSFSQQIGGAVVHQPSDVWVFGKPYFPGAGLGAWHYNGRTWSRVASGHGLEGGSGRSASDIWAFDGADVAHWNGSTWSRTSVAALLPAKQQLNDPAVTGIFAQSRHSVYAIANGGRRTRAARWYPALERLAVVQGGRRQLRLRPPLPAVQPPTATAACGSRCPASAARSPTCCTTPAGHLTQAALPGGPNRITVETVALIPGTNDAAGRWRHPRRAPHQCPHQYVVGVVLRVRGPDEPRLVRPK